MEEEYIGPLCDLVAEDYLFNLSSGIPVNDQLVDEILDTKKLRKELAVKFATEKLMVNGKMKFHKALLKTKFAAFKVIAKSTKVEKNNKQRTLEVTLYLIGL